MSEKTSLKLFSWNINGLRAVLKKGALVDFLEREYPDVLCLQEIKCKPSQVNLEKENEIFSDYEIFWNPAERPGYSGVCVLLKKGFCKRPSEGLSELAAARSVSSRGHPEVTTEDETPEPRDDGSEGRRFPKGTFEQKPPTEASENSFLDLAKNEGRIITIDLNSFYLVNVYVPNSKPDLSRLSLREKTWDPEFLNLLKTLEKEKPVVTCGDFNAAHEEIDLARPKTNRHSAGFTDEERKGITNLLGKGFLDTFRFKFPNSARYTWWSHWGKARANNVGWRIDYFFISKSLKNALTSAEIYESYLGSDHCPVSITLNLSELSSALQIHE